MGVVSVGNAEKGAEAEAEVGRGEVEVVLNEVCVKGHYFRTMTICCIMFVLFVV